jgi:hypothetical protein
LLPDYAAQLPPSLPAQLSLSVPTLMHKHLPLSSLGCLPGCVPIPPDTSDDWGLYPVSQVGFNRAQSAPTTPHTPHLFVIRTHAKHRPTPAPAISYISAPAKASKSPKSRWLPVVLPNPASFNVAGSLEPQCLNLSPSRPSNAEYPNRKIDKSGGVKRKHRAQESRVGRAARARRIC